MASLTIDELQVVVTANDKQMRRALADIYDQLGDVNGQATKMGKKSVAVFGVIAGAAQSLVNKGINLITSSVGSAAKRIDTLNNSQRVFQNMGFSAKDTKNQMDFLNKSILGLPTSLDDAVGGVEALASVSGDLKDSTKTYKALNDGILAFGGSADMVRGAVLQLSQLPMDGPLDAQTWNSLRQNGLTPVFAAMAKDSGKTISQLKADFGSGKLTVQDFTKELQKLDKDGGGGMASLEKQARDATHGIQTGWANMQTAITRGVADIMKSIGSKNISGAISEIGKAFENALEDVSGLIKYIGDHGDVFGTLAAAIGGATASIALYNAYIKLSAVYTAAFAAVSTYLTLVASLQAQGLGLLRAAWMALNITMAANPIGIVIALVAALAAGLIWFFTQTKIGREVVDTVFKSITAIFSAFVGFIKKWGPTILAVMFLPFSLLLGLVIKNWDTIKSVFSAVGGWLSSFFSGVWNNIKRIFSPVVGWFSGVFKSAYSVVTKVFSPIVGFFSGIWSRIAGLFRGAGTKMGGALGGAFKGVMNTILGHVAGTINGVIRAINGAINIINKIPKVNIGHIGQISVPRLATGGIVMPQPGGVLANIAEAGKPEAVIPLDKLEKMIGGSRQPVVVQIDGKNFLNFVIDGINKKAFMTNGPAIDW